MASKRQMNKRMKRMKKAKASYRRSKTPKEYVVVSADLMEDLPVRRVRTGLTTEGYTIEVFVYGLDGHTIYFKTILPVSEREKVIKDLSSRSFYEKPFKCVYDVIQTYKNKKEEQFFMTEKQYQEHINITQEQVNEYQKSTRNKFNRK